MLYGLVVTFVFWPLFIGGTCALCVRALAIEEEGKE